jgi:hypothetical protein
MTGLLSPACLNNSSDQRSLDDYDVVGLEGEVVGRIRKVITVL